MSDFWERMEDRMNEISNAAEQVAAALQRCADAMEMLVELFCEQDVRGERVSWPNVTVIRPTEED